MQYFLASVSTSKSLLGLTVINVTFSNCFLIPQKNVILVVSEENSKI